MGMVNNRLFTKKSKSHLIIAQIYVDDIIFGSTSQNLCDDFAKIMHDEFEMSMMGELNFFLGLQIKQIEDIIFFNQSKYIKEMLKKFGLEDSKPTKTPMSTEIKLTKDDEADSVDSSKYRGTGIETVVYVDSDHASDYVDRKSTSGVCTFMGCCLTSWFAKKQTALAISTTEAEYVSAGKACAIDLSKNPVQHSRTKHIEIRHHFLHDNIQKGNISIEKVASEDNIADIFTKPLKREVRILQKSQENEQNLDKHGYGNGRAHKKLGGSYQIKRDEELRPYIEFKLGQFTFKLTPSRLSQILQTPHALETFYTSKWSLNSLDDHPNSNFFGPKHDLVKKNITTPRTTQTQLLRDSNKLFLDDIRPDLRGWELFFRENFFCSLDKRNKVNACTAYMLYYLTIGRKFTLHEHVMDPLDISRNPSKEKGKQIAYTSVISSSSSSSELSNSKDLTKAQREKRRMFKCLNRYIGTITKYLEKQK
ncbi:retrovirus-related pol polyprotein from transposon TNT 1-94 [Tanacetum coccineum]